MADERKKATWAVSNTGMVTCKHVDGQEQSFNLTRLDSEKAAFLDMTPQQKDSLYYGVKQQLSDACARGKDEKLDDSGKRKVMADTFEDMVSGKYLETSRAKKGPAVRIVWTMEDFEKECKESGVPVKAAIKLYTATVKGFKIID